MPPALIDHAEPCAWTACARCRPFRRAEEEKKRNERSPLQDVCTTCGTTRAVHRFDRGCVFQAPYEPLSDPRFPLAAIATVAVANLWAPANGDCGDLQHPGDHYSFAWCIRPRGHSGPHASDMLGQVWTHSAYTYDPVSGWHKGDR